jgi:outer membrane receptor protein involved in Fe transport
MSGINLGVNHRQSVWARALLGSTMLAWSPSMMAADADAGPVGGLEEVVVTAEKRKENLQDVPAAVQALGQTTLDNLNVKSLDDYIGLLPSVSFGQAAGSPGHAAIFMRGISSGASGPSAQLGLPTVATYIDEIPTTTANGTIDFHIYDVARVEALAGPQGTVYGSSSEAGTLKIVTNQPDASKFSAGYDLDGNIGRGGGLSQTAEGFVNVPLSENMAIRLVGYHEHDAGYIDNVPHSLTYPSNGYTSNNASLIKKNFNPTETEGGRGEFKIDLNENWTVLATLMGQDQWTSGLFAYNPNIGVNQAGEHLPEKTHDSYYAPSLTITGKVADFDVTVVSSYLKHNLYFLQDYTDYSYFYDIASGFAAAYAHNAAGKPIDPGQDNKTVYHSTKTTEELRFASPSNKPLHVSGGVFYENQTDKRYYDQFIAGIDPAEWVPGDPNSIWQTRSVTGQVDQAVFTNVAYDILPNLTIEGGGRGFHYNQELDRFAGGGPGYAFVGHLGYLGCIPGSTGVLGSPCTDQHQHLLQSGGLYRGSVTYKITPEALVYFTTSDGFRPGGFNGNQNIPPYSSDSLVNYEFGWKTSWLDNRIRWNGDMFYDPWNNFQFAFQGPNGVSETVNAGQALSEGVETDLAFKVTSGLTVNAAASLINAHLTQPYCGSLNPNGTPNETCATPQAPMNTQLPDSPYFKSNLTARYSFLVGRDLDAYVQSSTRFQGGSWNYLQTLVKAYGQPLDPRTVTGRNNAYFQEDIATGVNWGNSNLELYGKNITDADGINGRFTKTVVKLTPTSYVVNIRPLTIGLRFGQNF